MKIAQRFIAGFIGSKESQAPPGAKEVVSSNLSFVPPGLGITSRPTTHRSIGGLFSFALMGWGIERLGGHSKSRSTYSMPCFFKNTSISSLNVILRWCSAWPSMYIVVSSTPEMPMLKAP